MEEIFGCPEIRNSNKSILRTHSDFALINLLLNPPEQKKKKRTQRFIFTEIEGIFTV